ncbi:MAG: hypothetical protein H6624_02965 [Bdellovibrionaceae bacterium]|nr:hypothetical protein [Pseudobdellovibrionaceae bacterium]
MATEYSKGGSFYNKDMVAMFGRLSRMSMHKKTTLLLFIGAIGFALYFFHSNSVAYQNRAMLTEVVEHHLPFLSRLSSLESGVVAVRDDLYEAAMKQNTDALGKLETSHRQALDRFNALSSEDSEVKGDLRRLTENFETTFSAGYELVQAYVVGMEDPAATQDKMRGHLTGLLDISREVDRIQKGYERHMKGAVEGVNRSNENAMVSGLVLMGVASAVGVLLILVMFKINRALNEANGNLYEASRRMHRICDETQVSSDQLKSSSIRQAHSATETAHSMEEIKKLLDRTYQITNQASQISEESYSEANKGRGVIDDLRISMSDIEAAYKDLEEVNEVVRQIHEKTRVINDIVFKTQLLSFNANIEAARAGQLGRGFAVVATEVGNLADLSGKAAEEIEGLLDTSARRVAQAIDQTRTRIERAQEMSNRCEGVFQNLIGRSGEIRNMVGNITTASSEQAKGVDQVVKAMVDLNQSAAETENLAQSMTHLADQLKQQSESLSFSVGSLNQLVKGEGELAVAQFSGDQDDDGDGGTGPAGGGWSGGSDMMHGDSRSA